MIYVTQQQRDNAIEALTVMWPSVPPENVSQGLMSWRRDYGSNDARSDRPTCDTLACFGGWCAWWPSFREQGVHAAASGAPRLRNSVQSATSVSMKLFGDGSLFSGRRYNEERGNDHEVVMRRLRNLIAKSKVIE